jgi:hypothetical protein
MKEWHKDLLAIDSMANHQSNLNLVLEAFLTSDYANDKEPRTEVIDLAQEKITIIHFL